MHCNGFAVYTGDGARERLTDSLQRVDRYRRKVMTSSGDEFLEPGNLRDSGLAIAVLLLGGERLPAVHGVIFDGPGFPEGEYSFLDLTNGGILAMRDLLGTRPLYIGHEGRCLASDHRFLAGSEGARLLPPGTTFRMRDASITTQTVVRATPPGSVEETAAEIAKLIERSVWRRVAGARRVAVSFSGGLDSAILAHCAARYTEVLLCSAYSNGSIDEKQTEAVAQKLDLPIQSRELSADDLRQELLALDLPFPASSMDEALWCIYSTTARIAGENGAEMILLGQLADELFGGYQKYARAVGELGESAAERMMEEDVAGCGRAGLIRDEQACSRYVEPRFPFADQEVAGFGLSIPVGFKIRNGIRKYVLREAARVLGLPDEVIETPKKAAQYSSGILKILP